MADPLNRVMVGEPLVIRAPTWNAMLDAARAFQNRHKGGAGEQRGGNDADMVLVKNASGFDVDRFGVLGVDTILFTPTANLNGFQNDFCLSCITPTVAAHTGKFVITAEPIPDGKLGRAYASGVCPVKLDAVGDFADVKASDRTQLAAGASGVARVLYREAATGWGIVRLGGGGVTEFDAIITGHAMLAEGSAAVGGGSSVTVQYQWKYAWSEAELVGDHLAIKSGGASGTTSTDYAANDAEDFHTAALSWGETITDASYPDNHRPKAVGGANSGSTTQTTHTYNVPVRMRRIANTVGAVKYRFNKNWYHSGSC